jgi:hypothetical protein
MHGSREDHLTDVADWVWRIRSVGGGELIDAERADLGKEKSLTAHFGNLYEITQSR